MSAETSSVYRRFIGVARIVLGLVVLVSVVYQIQDRLVHNVFRPGEYFAFFTIQTSLMDVVVLLAAGIYAFRARTDTKVLTIVRLCIVAMAIVTCVVYNLLLRDLPPEPGYIWPVWPNEVLHVWAPILLAADWLFAPGRYTVRLRASFWVLVYPLAWVAFSIVRGLATGWWPYPFLNPTEPAGWLGVVEYILGIAVFLLVNALVMNGIAVLYGKIRKSA